MNLERHRQDWDHLAEIDPFWAVLTRRGRKGGRWDVDEFFATGEAEVAHVSSVAGKLGRPARAARALDFGCGVGRLTRALGTRFDAALGVDISAVMVERAKQLNVGFPACAFRVNAARTSPSWRRRRSTSCTPALPSSTSRPCLRSSVT